MWNVYIETSKQTQMMKKWNPMKIEKLKGNEWKKMFWVKMKLEWNFIGQLIDELLRAVWWANGVRSFIVALQTNPIKFILMHSEVSNWNAGSPQHHKKIFFFELLKSRTEWKKELIKNTFYWRLVLSLKLCLRLNSW